MKLLNKGLIKKISFEKKIQRIGPAVGSDPSRKPKIGQKACLFCLIAFLYQVFLPISGFNTFCGNVVA